MEKSGEFWGGITDVQLDTDGNTILITSLPDFKLFVPQGSSVTKLKGPLKIQGEPWVKYIRYRTLEDGKNEVLFTENRAVDCVPLNRELKAIYLIVRKKGGGLATPGGFFSESDGTGGLSPAQPESIASIAVARELAEETGGSASQLIALGDVDATRADSREMHTRTWTFAGIVPTDTMHQFGAGDDAGQAQGSPELNKKGIFGWYLIEEGLPNGLAFAHHRTIIERAMGLL